MKRLAAFLAMLAFFSPLRARAQVVENVARPAIQRIQVNGVNLPRESTINFVGGGAVGSDDPGNLRINISVGGGSGAFPPLANDPGSPSAGQTWYNTTSNQFTLYNGTITSHIPLDFGGASMAGDVTGTIGANTVVAFQNRAFSGAAPGAHDVIFWNGSQWVPNQLTSDDIGAAFSVGLSRSGFSSPVEVGATITNPQFVDSHSQTPTSATMLDSVDTQNIVPATATALGYGGAANTFPVRSYSSNSLNAVKSWTYSATNAASLTRTASVSVQWEPRIYYGIATPPGSYNAAFITGLPSSGLQASQVNGTVAIGAGGNTKKAYYVLPSSYTNPTIFKDVATGFGVDMVKVASAVSVTNANGVVITYDIWESVNLLNASFTMSVS